MHSLWWLCKQVAATWITPANGFATNSEQDELHTTTLEIASTKTSDPATLTCTSESAELVSAYDDVEVPTTPTSIRKDTPRSNRGADSGYFSTHEICGKRRFEDEDVESTPCKPFRERPASRFDECAYRTQYGSGAGMEVSSSAAEEVGRERHDSVLGRVERSDSLIARGVCEDTVAQIENDALTCEIPSPDAYDGLESPCVDDPDDCEVLSWHSSGQVESTPEISSLGHTTPYGYREVTLPPRQILNSKFEQPVSAHQPFWKITDGIDPSYILRQVSCLQCVLKSLPCDQKAPHCSRCVRSGHGPCLVQRALLAEERWDAGLWGEAGSEDYTVLVRLKEDDEDTWTMKKEMEEALMAYLEEKAEKQNWVMPVNDGLRGGFKQENDFLRRRLYLDFARGHG